MESAEQEGVKPAIAGAGAITGAGAAITVAAAAAVASGGSGDGGAADGAAMNKVRLLCLYLKQLGLLHAGLADF